MTNIVNTIVVIPAKIAFWFRSVVYTFGSMWILDKKLEAVSTKTKKTRDDSSRSSAPLNDTSLDTVRAELLYSIKEYLRTLRDCLGSPLCGRWLSDPKNSGVYLKCAADLSILMADGLPPASEYRDNSLKTLRHCMAIALSVPGVRDQKITEGQIDQFYGMLCDLSGDLLFIRNRQRLFTENTTELDVSLSKVTAAVRFMWTLAETEANWEFQSRDLTDAGLLLARHYYETTEDKEHALAKAAKRHLDMAIATQTAGTDTWR